MFDGHVHIRPGKPTPNNLLSEMAEAGISGAIIISMPPDTGEAAERLMNLYEWTSGYEELVPFYWIDIKDQDTVTQVEKAKKSGAVGLKIICDSFYPGDEKCLKVCETAAGLGMPVLFHSGILWDGKPSSEYCRPVHFESLLSVKNLRFALAHIGWPWIDEMIALYGKFQNFRTRNPESRTEMFIDTTPGTPGIYREEAIRKLLTVGYDIEDNIFFGSDCDVNAYNAAWVEDWVAIDREIIMNLNVKDNVAAGIFTSNAERFIIGSEAGREFRKLAPAGN